MFIVTGGAGFIGSNLVAGLAKSKPNTPICVIDHLGKAQKWQNLAGVRVSHIVQPRKMMDFLDQHQMDIEAVFHMGACSSTTEENVDYIIRNNFTLSLKLWEWCSAHQKKFIYASSAATYGDGSQGFKDDQTIEYLDRLRPLNPYGWSKALTDSEFMRRAHSGHAPPIWMGLKFFNVYGPNEAHKGGQRSVAHQMFEQIESTGAVNLFKSAHPDYEDGGQMRDFVYVQDCVDAMLYPIHGKSIKNGIYNMGSGKARSFLDLAHACFAAFDQTPKINWIDTPPNIAQHYQYFTEAQMGSFISSLSQTTLEAGIKAYAAHYLGNKA